MSIDKPTDEELRELYFLFPENKPADARLPSIPEIQFSDDQVSELLKLLNPQTTGINPQVIRQNLIDAGRWFPESLYLQEFQSNSEIERKFAAIQEAAYSLLDQLGVKTGSITRIPHDVSSYLQIAACDYGSRVGMPRDVTPEQVPWNFWDAYKLPSVIVSVSLLEHWSGLARARLRADINPKNKRRNAGAQAMRVLIHRLALVWLQTYGKPPGSGYSTAFGKADEPFIRFALQYLKFMKMQITSVHLGYVEHIDEELTVLRRRRKSSGVADPREEDSRISDSIRVHLKSFKKRLIRAKN